MCQFWSFLVYPDLADFDRFPVILLINLTPPSLATAAVIFYVEIRYDAENS